jgi:hypothetical protein
MTGSFISDYYITLIKIIAILYVSVLFGIVGLGLTYSLDKYIFHSDDIKIDNADLDNISLFYILLTTVFIVGCLGVVSYIGRNIIQMIPFPLEGYHKFEYMRVKEVASGGILTVFLFAFSQTIVKKYKQLKYKMDIK